MQRILLLSLVLAIPSLPSCQQKAGTTSHSTSSGDNKTAATSKTKTAAQTPPRTPPPKQPAVSAPTAADLVKYTKDLPGTGALMATIETSMGTIHCELFGDKTPITVANFVGLARGLHPWRHPGTNEIQTKPYYDGVIFHRVIPKFMVQTGDPLGKGTGGPGYEFKDEFHPDLKHNRPALLSMAHPSRPNSNGGQFFITQAATPWLDNKHAIFGACDGADIITKITLVPKDPSDRSHSRPKDPVILKKVTIHRKAAAKPKATSKANSKSKPANKAYK